MPPHAFAAQRRPRHLSLIVHRAARLGPAIIALAAALAEAPASAQGLDAALPALPGRLSDACPEHFAGGGRPALLNPKLAASTVPLCFRGFAVLYSGVSRTPVYAAEHLTADRLAEARDIDRVDAFHEEAALPPSLRSTLSDYVGSGYDRGHMAPSADMADDEAQRQSFSLANMVPQDPDDNRGLWSDIEQAVRSLARRRGEVYVVTGPVFSGATIGSLKGRVLVPSQLFKAVYDPASRRAAAYIAPNAPGREWRAVSLPDLRTAAGIDAFPGVPVEGVLTLPTPQARPTVHRERAPESWSGWIEAQIRRILRHLARHFLRAVLG